MAQPVELAVDGMDYYVVIYDALPDETALDVLSAADALTPLPVSLVRYSGITLIKHEVQAIQVPAFGFIREQGKHVLKALGLPPSTLDRSVKMITDVATMTRD